MKFPQTCLGRKTVRPRFTRLRCVPRRFREQMLTALHRTNVVARSAPCRTSRYDDAGPGERNQKHCSRLPACLSGLRYCRCRKVGEIERHPFGKMAVLPHMSSDSGPSRWSGLRHPAGQRRLLTIYDFTFCDAGDQTRPVPIGCARDDQRCPPLPAKFQEACATIPGFRPETPLR